METSYKTSWEKHQQSVYTQHIFFLSFSFLTASAAAEAFFSFQNLSTPKPTDSPCPPPSSLASEIQENKDTFSPGLALEPCWWLLRKGEKVTSQAAGMDGLTFHVCCHGDEFQPVDLLVGLSVLADRFNVNGVFWGPAWSHRTVGCAFSGLRV